MFRIRPAGADPHDVDTLVAIFDSTVPALSASGNAGQWGSQLWSEREGFIEETRHDVIKSERFRQTGEGDRVRTFIAQLQDDDVPDAPDGLHRFVDEHGKAQLPAGAMTIRDSHFPSHLYQPDALKPHIQAAEEAPGGFAFIDVLVSDYRLPAEKRRGAGAALVEAAKDYARGRNMRFVFVDCWIGGDGKLVPYYERFGFKSVQSFDIHKKNGTTWPGQFMRLDLAEQ